MMKRRTTMKHHLLHWGTYLLCACGLLLLSGQQDFQQWLAEQDSAMQEFKDRRDKEFLNYLEKDWKEFQAYDGLVRDPAPKPPEIPLAASPAGEPLPDVPIIEEVAIPPMPAQPKPEPAPPPATSPTGREVKFLFFGIPVQIVVDKAIENVGMDEVNEEGIRNFWSTMSRTDYSPAVQQLESLRDRLGLNDWGYVHLTSSLGKSIYGERGNEWRLLSWFLLTKSGIQTRIGYHGEVVYLLLPSESKVFGVPFLTLEGEYFYIIPLGTESTSVPAITSYQGTYPNADRRIDFRLRTAPAFGNNPKELSLKFEYGGEEHTLPVKLNRHLIDFYNSYPQTDIPIYFGALLSAEAAGSLLHQLRPLVQGKSETKAVNILLRFVQTAFRYETDAQQFGAENYLFPEETLFYPASDCEDRSALFAYLVRNLLDREVIGLDYPGHIATAVKFHGDVGRDFIMHEGAKYTVADPTFIRAEYGMTMPAVREKTPEVFLIP